MPFDYAQYRLFCKGLSDEQLQQEFQRYVRMLGSSSASMGIGAGLAFFTFGLSLIGTAAGAASTRNAIKKMEIIEEECNGRGINPNFRKRDFFKCYGVGCTIGAVSHGAGGHLVGSAMDHVTSHAVHHAANHAMNQGLQHTTYATNNTSGSHDTVVKLIEKSTEKVGEKGGEALEEHVYGETVISRKQTSLEKNGDKHLWSLI